MHLTAIHIYPVKSLAGISLTESVVESRGLRYDRRWMMVTPEGRFLTQREYPAMALIGTAIEPPFLVLFDRGNPDNRIGVPLAITSAGKSMLGVNVWDDHCPAAPVSTEADMWLSDRLGAPVRLVGMPETTSRDVDLNYAPEGQIVSFADAYPFLIIGEATLTDLNSRLEIPVPMNRFRPNFVFSGGTAFCEDEWGDFSIGDQPFQAVKPCARCIMTTIDQQTTGKNEEPLKTLSGYRKQGNKVLFGQNLIWTGEGEVTIKRNDKVLMMSDE